MVIKKPKPETGKKPASTVASASGSPASTPDVVVNTTPSVATPELRKKELIDTVVARSGIKKRDAKPVIEAMLAVMGEVIADGRDMNIAPMGKLKITRMKKTTKAQVTTMRLRRSEPQPEDLSDPLAQAAE